MGEIAIRVTDVHKSFKIYYDKGQSFKEKILFQNRNRHENRAVLNGVSFEVQKGEAIGLVGQNGCGKSTMLKLLTKIMYPDSGNIEMNGRVSSLIELGAGFHQDMTGKENIYTNASIFGLTRKEIDARIAQIIEFSELGEFIDNPVRTYSSGMYMRLAFAVAINVDADILLIDEILAVGDANFQAKCFNKMKEIKRKGTTIVIVSHDMGSIERMCDRAIWIKDGVIALEDKPRNVVRQYLDDVMNGGGSSSADGNTDVTLVQGGSNNIDGETQTLPVTFHSALNAEAKRIGNGNITIQGVAMYNSSKDDNIPCYCFETRETARLHVDYQCNNPQIKPGIFSIRIFRNDGIDCFGTNTFLMDGTLLNMTDANHIDFYFDPIQLLSGKYTLDLSYHDDAGQIFEHITDAVIFEVYCRSAEVGVTHIHCRYAI